MESHITVSEKREFLKWFTENFDIRLKEVNYLLDYIMADEKLLNRISFVDNARTLNMSIYIIANGEGFPFQFRLNGKVFGEIDKTILEISKNSQEQIHMQLVFPGKEHSPQYARIKQELQNSESVSQKIILEAEFLAEYLVAKREIELLDQKVEEALKNDDREAFVKWSDERNRFLENNEWILWMNR